MWLLLAALGGSFLLPGSAPADDVQNLGRFKPPAAESTSPNAKPLLDEKKQPDDTERIHYYRRYAYWGVPAPVYYGGYAYSYSFAAPGFAMSYYPSFVAPGPIFGIPRVYYAPAYTYWGYCAGDALAPSISLHMNVNPQPSGDPSRQMPPATAPQPMPGPGTIPPATTFPYDGGPAKPVPMPTPDRPGTAPTAPTPPSAVDDGSLKIKFAVPIKKPLAYAAYGEKK
jgi:hypothetical protein